MNGQGAHLAYPLCLITAAMSKRSHDCRRTRSSREAGSFNHPQRTVHKLSRLCENSEP
jgi:hypothetical protein